MPMRITPPIRPLRGRNLPNLSENLSPTFRISITSNEQIPKKIPEMTVFKMKASVSVGVKSKGRNW